MPLKTTDIANLDFEDIRSSLKAFLKNQDEFTDYDFEGSGISTLVDLLSYNTHMNALMSHLVMNESYLDTAQLRSNVVSMAQRIGYTPKSAVASRATLSVTFQGTGPGLPSSITMPKGYQFTGKINNKEYTFVTTTSYNANKAAGDVYVFNDVVVYEGVLKTLRYNIDSLDLSQKYEIFDSNVDLNTLTVKVFENANTEVGTTYKLLEQAGDSGLDAEIYFVKENSFGKYNIFFGDNYIGKRPESGNVISLEYIVTNGTEANNIISLSAAGDVYANNGITEITNTATTIINDTNITYGAREREDIESIRFNAPIIHATQDRAVTANDYRSLLLAQFEEFTDVSVWGGEDATPPVYGRVFITPALADGVTLSNAFKAGVVAYLKTKNIGTATPEIIDAEYTNLQLFVGVKYDTTKTTKTAGELETLVRTTIDNYNDTILNKFNAVFRQSNLLSAIDRADEGIISTIIRTNMYKTFVPNPTRPDTYTISFPTPIDIQRLTGENSPTAGNITSSVFTIDNVQAHIGDTTHPTDPTRRTLHFYNATTGFIIDGYADVGYMDFAAGVVVIENIKFGLSTPIMLYVQPDSYDVAPKYNRLLNIDSADITVAMEYDTVSANGASGLSTYTTFKR